MKPIEELDPREIFGHLPARRCGEVDRDKVESQVDALRATILHYA